MIWVCRAGQNACYLNEFANNNRIYIPWEGFTFNLKKCNSLLAYRPLVELEKHTSNRTSVSNWSGQLFSFCHEMMIGDYVLIPHAYSREYDLARIVGEYQYSSNDELHHSRAIDYLLGDIPRTAFPQSIQYSLGAYRTIFKPKNEDEILSAVNKWKKSIQNKE